jgi:hypothetical protein
MPLRLAFVTAWLPHILAHACFIPVPADRPDDIALGPNLSPPQTFFDGWNAVHELTSREAFDDLDHLGRALTRHRLHQNMDVIVVSAKL